jgi:hypothetical protein
LTFAAAWAFAGLALLAPLVLLHLHRRGEVVREVPSLLLWDQLDLVDAQGARGLRWPSLPLLLFLQSLALVTLVFALAEPTSPGSAAKPAQVVVLDDSWRMQAPGRIDEATDDVERLIAADPTGTPIRIVLAAGSPIVLYRGGLAGARAALARVQASAAPADLTAALTVAAGLLGGRRDSVLLVRAPEDPLPPVSARPGELRTLTLASPVGDQGIFDAGARCGIGASAACEVYATVRNTTDHAVEDRISADAAGHPPLALQVPVASDSSAPLALASEPGQQVSLRVLSNDRLPADDEAWVTVPAAGDLPTSSIVTLVGTPSVALATAQAFAAVPGVTLRLRTRATFRASDAEQSSLVVLDHWLPRDGLPPSPAVLLVDPPRLPGGRVGGALAETAVSGTDGASQLLDGVELSSLSIDPRAASELTAPRWLAPVVWSPDGVLLAAGDSGHQRVAALSFEPSQSDLPQLSAFPILAANLVQWASGWAPATASAGVPFAVDATVGIRSLTLERSGAVLERVRVGQAPVVLDVRAPGLYTIRESGLGVTRDALVAVNTADVDDAAPADTAGASEVSSEGASEASSAGAQTVDLETARTGSAKRAPLNQAFWFLAAALVALALEWAYWISRRRRVAL